MIEHVCNRCGAALNSPDDRAGSLQPCECGATNRVPSGSGRYVSTSATWRTSVAFVLGLISLAAWTVPPWVGLAVAIVGIVFIWVEAGRARSLTLLIAAILCAMGLTLAAVRLATAA